METKIVKNRVKAGGRTKGTPNKKNKELIEQIEASGLTPLEYMLGVMRNPEADPKRRDALAAAAAPYVHAKLASIEHKGVGKDGAIIIQSTPTDEKL